METVAYLKGEGTRDPRLHEVVMALAGEMLALGDLAPSVAAGRARAEAALEDGRAAEKFAQHGVGAGRARRFPRACRRAISRRRRSSSPARPNGRAMWSA